MAAPGDLDASFGDVGRQSSIESASSYSNLWSVDVQGDDSVLIGGGIEIWFGYVLVLFVLLVRPQGLFGEKIIDRV